MARAPKVEAPGGRSRSSQTPSTRDRLVAAVLEIVRSDGLGALTTVEITRRAGIAQPGFYKHFRNVDECLEEATTEALDGMRETFGAMRRRIRDRNDPAEVAAYFLAVLDAVAADRSFNELLARYRRDTSTLGRAVRDAELRVMNDFVEELWGQAKKAGIGAAYRGRVALVAELIFGALGAAIERVVDDPGADRRALADDLAAFAIAGTRSCLGRLLADPDRRQRRT
ncbi:MAG TPA: TetR/AcrR family transcriptional regulator [Polyangiaceae bacterium]|nr:TetR/AcrR family transcriptional regulator [Polyangiaceae bacterium]